jgi:hypothetical protein
MICKNECSQQLDAKKKLGPWPGWTDMGTKKQLRRRISGYNLHEANNGYRKKRGPQNAPGKK